MFDFFNAWEVDPSVRWAKRRQVLPALQLFTLKSGAAPEACLSVCNTLMREVVFGNFFVFDGSRPLEPIEKPLQ